MVDSHYVWSREGHQGLLKSIIGPHIRSQWLSHMELTAEQFIEIVNGLEQRVETVTEGEQRRRPRLGLRASGTLIPLSDSANPSAIAIEIRDVSSAGIGFLHNKKMSLDEQFALVLPRTGDTPSVVLCAVAFWQPLARNLFAIGGRFIRVLRDGGSVPLPIQTTVFSSGLSSEIEQLHRKAS
jgi:hypothetical protein